MINKTNWTETKEHFEAWWDGKGIGRPLMNLRVRKEDVPAQPMPEPLSAQEKHVGVAYKDALVRANARQYQFLAEAYPVADLNLGPGSLAVYLGSEPVFRDDTIWFTECVEDFTKATPFRFDPHNPWFIRHLEWIKALRACAGQDYVVTVPDIVEGVDILAAMRGPQALCYDLMDMPEVILARLDQLKEVFYPYFDAFNEATRYEPGLSQFTAFRIIGKGRIAKIQCDFAALMSPGQFEEFALPTVVHQSEHLDRTMFHLDGPDCIRHADILMQAKRLNALQWTPGAGKPDGLDEGWYPLYDCVRKAGKSLWISMEPDKVNVIKEKVSKLYKRYGSDGLYLQMPVYDESTATELLLYAEKHWR